MNRYFWGCERYIHALHFGLDNLDLPCCFCDGPRPSRDGGSYVLDCCNHPTAPHQCKRDSHTDTEMNAHAHVYIGCSSSRFAKQLGGWVVDLLIVDHVRTSPPRSGPSGRSPEPKCGPQGIGPVRYHQPSFLIMRSRERSGSPVATPYPVVNLLGAARTRTPNLGTFR